jgi:signal transduction histidine kinase
MLRKLGRRLTLLNSIISGAILLAMALAALYVAENTVESQFERELNAYTMSVLPAVGFAGIETRGAINVPDKYFVYSFDNEQKPIRLGGADVEVEGIQIIVNEANAALGTPRVVSGARVSENGIVDGNVEAVVSATFIRGDNMISGVRGAGYRVSSTMINMGDSSTPVLILQDRAEEFSARDRLRWLFALCVAGGMALITLSSRFLSNRAIKPVENSIKQQREFVAAASHELRTPVTALRANAEVLKDAELGEYAPFLDTILGGSEQLSRLIADLINLARADAGELEMERVLVDVADTAREAARLMRPLAEKAGVKLLINTEPALITGDPDRLKQALVALIDNAFRYGSEGNEVAIAVAKRGHNVIISVSDRGIGIEDAHKQRVFDRFYRVDAARSRSHGGAGLGLSIVKQIVEQMGGTVALNDNPGGGCIFRLMFPVST